MRLLHSWRVRNRAHRFRRQRERWECQFARDCLRQGDVVLDIGAHRGAFTYWFARSVGPQGAVVAFEPQPRLFEELQRVASSIRWRNITVFGCALGDENGEAQLAVPRHNSSCATLVDGSGQADTDFVTVPVTRLDDFLERTGRSKPIAFIKCDVEGFELSVFKGGRRVLTEDRPVLLFESFDNPHSKQDVFAFLANLNYRGYTFSGSTLVPLSRLDRGPTSHNYVFLPNDCTELLSAKPPFEIRRCDHDKQCPDAA